MNLHICGRVNNIEIGVLTVLSPIIKIEVNFKEVQSRSAMIGSKGAYGSLISKLRITGFRSS